jgi:hypothetical protein
VEAGVARLRAGEDAFVELSERARFVAAVQDGLDDVAAERTMTTAELKSSLERELGPIAWR